MISSDASPLRKAQLGLGKKKKDGGKKYKNAPEKKSASHQEIQL